MSLWTPDGERPVRRSAEPAAAEAPRRASATPAGGPSAPAEPSIDDLSPEEQVQAQAMLDEMTEVRERIAQTPAAEVLANHLMGFYELAAIHLSQEPPNFTEAAVAIDALRIVLGGMVGRLGENEAVLTQALTQIQMAFVQLKDGAGPPA